MEKESELIYYIGPSENKGLGMFAKSKITRGQLVIAEKPLILTPSLAPDSLLDRLVANMTDADRSLFFALHNNSSASPSSSTIKDIIRTNGIRLGTEEDANGGVFANISRINHSCRPNVHHFWSADKKMELVHALKEISPGEEIFTSYIDLYATRDERRAKLKESFGFECQCELCSEQNPDLVLKSDTRRKDLRRLDSEIMATAAFNHQVAMLKVKRLLSLLKEENMDYHGSYVGRVCYDAFSISYQTNKKNLSYWAKQVVDNFMIAQGEFDCRFKNEVLSYCKRK